mgnify:FL=1
MSSQKLVHKNDVRKRSSFLDVINQLLKSINETQELILIPSLLNEDYHNEREVNDTKKLLESIKLVKIALTANSISISDFLFLHGTDLISSKNLKNHPKKVNSVNGLNGLNGLRKIDKNQHEFDEQKGVVMQRIVNGLNDKINGTKGDCKNGINNEDATLNDLIMDTIKHIVIMKNLLQQIDSKLIQLRDKYDESVFNLGKLD